MAAARCGSGAMAGVWVVMGGTGCSVRGTSIWRSVGRVPDDQGPVQVWRAKVVGGVALRSRSKRSNKDNIHSIRSAKLRLG